MMNINRAEPHITNANFITKMPGLVCGFGARQSGDIEVTINNNFCYESNRRQMAQFYV